MKGQTKKRMTMGRVRGAVIALAVVVIVGLALWVRSYSGATGTTNSASATTQASVLTRTNEGGLMTVKVTWQGRNAGPVFTVQMDTHAIDLDGYDLRQLAVLRIDQGVSIHPSGWNAPAGGHHRSGTLSFLTTTVSGNPVIGPDTRTITLIIRNVGSVAERVFIWTL